MTAPAAVDEAAPAMVAQVGLVIDPDPDAAAPDVATPDGTGPSADEPVVPPADEPLVADHVSDGERVSTPAVDASGTQTVGVTWPEGADGDALAAAVRTLQDGTWSDWTDLPVADDAPDEGSADAGRAPRGGTDAVWVGDVDAVQLSFAADAAAAAVGDVKVALVGDAPLASDPPTPDAGVADAAGVISPAAFTSSGAVEVGAVGASQGGPVVAAAQPTVVSRAAWGARAQACAPDVASELVGAVVHHTATTNSYGTVAAAMQQLRNIQAYHIDGRGWCDVGYNFLVDKWGNIYEGRANGMTQPVVGVHAGGFNTGTVGVSMLGDYTSATPSTATQDAVGRIIGWRLGRYGLDPRGSMSYYTGNGDNSRFKNQWVTLPRVFAHRDTAFTTCPGNGGYATLGTIRTVAARNTTQFTLAQAQSVVRALYVDLLGREVDPSGLATWTNELMAGRPPAVVVDTLTRSYEYRRLRISQAYQEVFGRAPDEGGLVAWTNEVASGAVTVDDVKRRLLDSGEFFSRSGGTPQGYVARLYQSVLGRTASEQEVESWSARFASLGRSGVATAIWGSRESAMWRSGLYYPVLLGRAADRGGLMTWSTVLLRDGEAAVRNGMAASGEYRNRAVSRFPA